ncbi:MAG: SsrA-binding protein [Candidatus Tagabacteria bacterium CG_4_10_14_0_2_um_filter_40_13]|uniref:SsrA-binding protein n=3 Tax=Candidatus Tagaibacteriota TaxID=1817918 RepID=A0A2M7B8N5_9BACT|nr:MAG: SsrA-binding protein [Candidatus Tagabacteria bacterium CG11_big_fil_rev_8_21_14_0_20_41_11]PIU99476.1 MAG: SsrA-binding protein [Candidatus Tagabacteria bacterium CG03_land_8_20_14_0_80_41_22]PIZ56570.1 MAG: SsrA-binding protein [Candidatus Tagabacteria bacterium CG_4_10_14_0_2_um_filter_40_13]
MSLIENRKAYHDYEILEKFEAGLELKGFEVKALKNGRGSLAGSRVIIRGNEAFIVGMDIPPYQSANTPKNYDSQATRRLLLKKKEIAYLNGKSNEAGLTLISLGIYTKKGFLKLAFAIGRGLKKYDKRERIKEKEVKRKIDREIKGF